MTSVIIPSCSFLLRATSKMADQDNISINIRNNNNLLLWLLASLIHKIKQVSSPDLLHSLS